MKKMTVLVCALCLFLSGLAMAEEANGTTVLFETEYTYLEDVVGGGISGAAAGLNMIVENADASNGFYVGSTHSTNCIITYAVSADADATATLRVLLGNELSAMQITPETLIIKVNDEVFEFDAFELPAEVKTVGKTFTQFNLGDIQLVNGENTITFQVGENEYCNGTSGGPLFDAIKLTSEAELSMTEYPENIE